MVKADSLVAPQVVLLVLLSGNHTETYIHAFYERQIVQPGNVVVHEVLTSIHGSTVPGELH